MVFASVYISGFITGSESIQRLVIRNIGYLLPNADESVGSIMSNISTSGKEIGALVLIGVIWGSISFFDAIRVSLNTAWGINNPRSIFKDQFVNFIMLVGAGIFLLLSVLLTTIITINYSGMQLIGVVFLGRHLTISFILINIFIMVLAFLVFLILI